MSELLFMIIDSLIEIKTNRPRLTLAGSVCEQNKGEVVLSREGKQECTEKLAETQPAEKIQHTKFFIPEQ